MENTVDKLWKTYNMFKAFGAANFGYCSEVINSVAVVGTHRVLFLTFHYRIVLTEEIKRVRAKFRTGQI